MRTSARLWKLDAARGGAVVAMVLFNWLFALSFLGIAAVDGGWTLWWLAPRLVGGTFIFIAGVSFWISYCRAVRKHPSSEIFKKYFHRGIFLFGLGMLATIATLVFYPTYTIWFGILHFLGVAVAVAPFLARFIRWVLLLAVVLFTAGILLMIMASSSIITTPTIAEPLLLWLGIVPANFSTFDYFPLLPWLGVFLAGAYAGQHVVRKSVMRQQQIRHTVVPPVASLFAFLGRHSLLVYIVHQPVLIAALYAARVLVF